MKYAVVVVGYNRVEGMKRLISSLCKAEYYGESVDLIISIDNSGTDIVEKFANDIKWKYGEKIIRTFERRQGLRKHILKCGDYLNDYDAIAVFEDDIFVSPSFFNYMRQAVDFYHDNKNVAGISLYKCLHNQNVNQSFDPSANGYDAFFMQYAQSWGQVWMKKQWFEFKHWYEHNCEEFGPDSDVPDFVSGWPETSWLKYHIKYCIKNNKYFVYPDISLTTCFSDVGEHCLEKVNTYQVPIQYSQNIKYKFPEFNGNAVFYDAFFERMNTNNCLMNEEDIDVDLYGSKKPGRKRYLLSTNKYNYSIVKSYALDMRPHENNVIFNIEGDDIFLYDTNVQCKNKFKKENLEVKRLIYYCNILGKTKIMAKAIAIKLITKLKNIF